MATASATDGTAVDSAFGWLLAVIGFVVLTVTWGTMFTFTVFSEPLAAAFGLTALQASTVFSVQLFFFYTFGGLLGLLISRVRFRPLLVGIALLVLLSIGALQLVTSYGLVVAVFGLLGVLYGMIYVSVLSVVPQWFETHEGLAVGLAVSGNGAGIQVMPIVWSALLAGRGFRTAYTIVGVAIAAVVTVAAVVWRRNPDLVDETGSTAVDRTWLRELAGDRSFQAAFFGISLIWAWYYMLAGSMVDVLTAVGFERAVAAAAFGSIGTISILSRIGSGFVGDRVGPLRTMVGATLAAAVGLLVLTTPTTQAVVYVAIVLLGAGLGGIAALHMPILIRRFGAERASAIVGLFFAPSALSGFATPVAVSYLRTATGTYVAPLVAIAAVTVVGIALFYRGVSADPSP